jgi:hypothetical protein
MRKERFMDYGCNVRKVRRIIKIRGFQNKITWETTDPACTIYDLDETQTYYFTVRAFSPEGFQSGNSNEVCLEAGTTTGN